MDDKRLEMCNDLKKRVEYLKKENKNISPESILIEHKKYGWRMGPDHQAGSIDIPESLKDIFITLLRAEYEKQIKEAEEKYKEL